MPSLTWQYLCSTMFLMGPLAQLKKMFEKGRIIATSIYIGALFLTLWMAVKVGWRMQDRHLFSSIQCKSTHLLLSPFNTLHCEVDIIGAQLHWDNPLSPCSNGGAYMVSDFVWTFDRVPSLVQQSKHAWSCAIFCCRYCMSYIPFARAMASKMFSSFMSGWANAVHFRDWLVLDLWLFYACCSQYGLSEWHSLWLDHAEFDMYSIWQCSCQ